MNNGSNTYIAVKIELDAEGDLERISFEREGSGFGNFHEATLYDDYPSQIPDGVELVLYEHLVSHLYGYVRDRKSLYVISDFADCEYDENDELPVVFRTPMVCDACALAGTLETTHNTTRVVCPRCKHVAQADTKNAQWIGPQTDFMRVLWSILPDEFDSTVFAKHNFYVTAAEDGIVVHDLLFTKVKVMNGPEGVIVQIFDSRKKPISIASMNTPAGFFINNGNSNAG